MENVKETIELLDAVFDIADSTKKAMADGKVTLSDAPAFFGVAWKLPTAIGGIEKVPNELKHLGDEGRAKVLAHFRGRFDLADDQLELAIEDALEMGWDFAQAVQRLAIYRRAA